MFCKGNKQNKCAVRKHSKLFKTEVTSYVVGINTKASVRVCNNCEYRCEYTPHMNPPSAALSVNMGFSFNRTTINSNSSHKDERVDHLGNE